jgi:hypothetical protein
MIKSIYEQPCINRALTRVLSSESKKEKNERPKANMQAWQTTAISPVTPHYIVTPVVEEQKSNGYHLSMESPPF